ALVFVSLQLALGASSPDCQKPAYAAEGDAQDGLSFFHDRKVFARAHIANVDFATRGVIGIVPNSAGKGQLLAIGAKSDAKDDTSWSGECANFPVCVDVP